MNDREQPQLSKVQYRSPLVPKSGILSDCHDCHDCHMGFVFQSIDDMEDEIGYGMWPYETTTDVLLEALF